MSDFKETKSTAFHEGHGPESDSPNKARKTVSIIISVITALVLWGYVVGVKDPTITTTFYDVPVQILNMDSLTNRELAIVGDGNYTVDVVLEGKRAEIKKIKKEDIVAQADLIGFGRGNNYVQVQVGNLPVTISEIRPSKIQVAIEDLVSVQKSVLVVFEGTLPENMEQGAIEMKPEQVSVTGAESEVAKVAKVQVSVSAASFTSAGETVQGEAVPLDSSGAPVKNVVLSSTYVDVYARLFYIKEVPLNILTAGDVKEGYGVEINGPQTIKIKGTKNSLKDVESIDTEPVDLASISRSGRVNLVPDLPDGVQLSSQVKELTAEATVVALVTKSFEYTGDKIQMEGLADGLALTVDTPSVTATAGGTAEVIDGLTSADIALTCDLSQLAAGTHQVQVTASCGKALHTLIVEPQSIQVTVTPEVAEQPQ